MSGNASKGDRVEEGGKIISWKSLASKKNSVITERREKVEFSRVRFSFLSQPSQSEPISNKLTGRPTGRTDWATIISIK